MIEYQVIPLREILIDESIVSKIEESFKKFSCQREKDLENFLMRKAITYEKTNFGKTYLCIDKKELEKNQTLSIIAYFTIAQNSLDISNLSNKKKRKVLGNYPGRDSLNSIPTYLIGQLGRNDAYSSDDLSGEQILKECYHALSIAAKIIGGNLLILECREHMFDKFYSHYGFQKLYDTVDSENLFTLYQKINFDEYWKI